MENSFVNRHIGIDSNALNEMLNVLNVSSIDQLISETIPSNIRSNKELAISSALTEREYLDHIQSLSEMNELYDCYIGQGYYGTETPSVILRNVLENPGWYTAYTPYQAEISQGRLEALLNFQTVVSELTGMELANASLLDEGTAAAEAMLMFYHMRSRQQEKNNVNQFFIAENIFRQTKDVMISRAEPLGIQLTFGDPEKFEMSDAYFGMYLLAMGKGVPRSHAKIHKLLREAGFSSIKSLKVTLPIQTGLIVAKA